MLYVRLGEAGSSDVWHIVPSDSVNGVKRLDSLCGLTPLFGWHWAKISRPEDEICDPCIQLAESEESV